MSGWLTPWSVLMAERIARLSEISVTVRDACVLGGVTGVVRAGGVGCGVDWLTFFNEAVGTLVLVGMITPSPVVSRTESYCEPDDIPIHRYFCESNDTSSPFVNVICGTAESCSRLVRSVVDDADDMKRREEWNKRALVNHTQSWFIIHQHYKTPIYGLTLSVLSPPWSQSPSITQSHNHLRYGIVLIVLDVGILWCASSVLYVPANGHIHRRRTSDRGSSVDRADLHCMAQRCRSFIRIPTSQKGCGEQRHRACCCKVTRKLQINYMVLQYKSFAAIEWMKMY